MVRIPLCPSTKCRNTKGADGRFFLVNIQPSRCPKQVAGLQDIWRQALSNHYALPHVRQSTILTLWSRVLLEKLNGLQLVKQFSAFYGTVRFITAFTTARHLFYPEPARSSPYPHIPFPEDPFNTILPSTAGCPSLRFSQQNPVHTSPLRSPVRATCLTHFILLDFITRTVLGEAYRTLSSSLCSFLHSTVTSSLVCTNILLNTLFSKTSAYVPPSARATKFHTHTKQKTK